MANAGLTGAKLAGVTGRGVDSSCRYPYTPIVLASVRNAMKRKEVAAFLREAVCAKCAQVEENAGFVFCRVKRRIVARGRRVIPGRVGSDSSNGT